MIDCCFNLNRDPIRVPDLYNCCFKSFFWLGWLMNESDLLDFLLDKIVLDDEVHGIENIDDRITNGTSVSRNGEAVSSSRKEKQEEKITIEMNSRRRAQLRNYKMMDPDVMQNVENLILNTCRNRGKKTSKGKNARIKSESQLKKEEKKVDVKKNTTVFKFKFDEDEIDNSIIKETEKEKQQDKKSKRARRLLKKIEEDSISSKRETNSKNSNIESKTTKELRKKIDSDSTKNTRPESKKKERSETKAQKSSETKIKVKTEPNNEVDLTSNESKPDTTIEKKTRATRKSRKAKKIIQGKDQQSKITKGDSEDEMNRKIAEAFDAYAASNGSD
ncbi:hypothetical protein TPHA_0N01880 [Tetrapisispora phaffii CBS 4417]|uniref:Uncharacterized protein n=1 Tax=Tetrapisispora phaffii (strain ATCC 24235 / CBS 4417 / NBRC 1672 / NRRL Y-8282 / UCD 70-5) TaxID=1071381 RepID=G8C1E1_TETPH|nr:hypothetical protein TPHA_0N01880 [Tetrapisispora phaffii CBS 4417]CCE65969.1 hypothetical protein TPHA_0N01880 [Tetrapisispora phaffii CBS 4417]